MEVRGALDGIRTDVHGVTNVDVEREKRALNYALLKYHFFVFVSHSRTNLLH